MRSGLMRIHFFTSDMNKFKSVYICGQLFIQVPGATNTLG